MMFRFTGSSSRRARAARHAALALALALVGCGGGEGGNASGGGAITPPTAIFTGRFVLQSVGGVPVPARLDSTSGGTLTALGDTLVIEAGGAYRGAARLVFRPTAGLGQQTREPYAGTAVAAGPDSVALQGSTFVTGRARLVGGNFLIVRTQSGARVPNRSLEYVRVTGTR